MHKDNCQKYILLIDEYIDGNLGEKELEEFEKHLSDCPKCREEYRMAITLRKLIKQSAEEVPEGLHAKIMASVTAEKKDAPAKRSRSRIRRSAAVSAACFAVFIAVCLVFTQLPLSNQSTGEHVDIGGMTSDLNSGWSDELDGANENIETDAPSFDGLNPEDTSTYASDGHNPAPSTDKAETKSPNITDVPSSNEPETVMPAADATEFNTSPPLPDSSFDAAPDYIIPPSTNAPTASRPGANEITLALLIVSGLLAVASFIAFLISLSSIRKLPVKKEDEK